MTPRAILLMGPTGVGKTDVAVSLVERWPLEIVSVDSAMVFRGMDIGTAKPDAAVRARAPHHLLDLLDPAESYSAGQFVADAERAMADIRSRGRVPLLVGGTMLYFRALQAGLAELPTRDPAVRAAIDARAADAGWPALHAELAALDPLAAAGIQPTDRQRIQRALEIIELTGRPASALRQQDLRQGSAAGWLKLALVPEDRSALAARLTARFQAMLRQGLVEEVEALWRRGDLHPDLPSIRCVGYRQLWGYLAGATTLNEAIELAVIATRQLAKRQLTWLRREPELVSLEPFASGVDESLSVRLRTWLAGE